MLQTLVLNTSEIPISIIPYRNILNRVCNESARVLKYYEGTWIKSAGFDVSMFSSGFERTVSASNIVMQIPSVVQCLHTDYIPEYTRVLPFTRKNLYVRDRGRCAYCLKKLSLHSLSFDHVIPRCLGGKTCWENIVLACFRCNSKKGARHPDQFKWPQLRPYAPTLSKAAPAQLVNKVASEVIEKTWEDYIYWEIQLME
jgi:5-methylcytosine-specific restriction endonuclease McrA